MAFKDDEILPNVLEEFGLVVEEGLNVEEGSEFRETDFVGPFDFTVNGINVKTVPHFDLVDCIGGNIVDTC